MNNIELELLEGVKEVEQIKEMYKFISTYNVYKLLLAHCKNKNIIFIYFIQTLNFTLQNVIKNKFMNYFHYLRITNYYI